MQELADFRQRMESRFPQLTKSERAIASYLLASHDEAAFLSAAELALRLGVSQATVVRFARSVGYDGFPGLRREIQSLVRVKAAPAVRLQHKLEELGSSRGQVFARIVEMEVEYLTEALHSVDQADLDRAVSIILGARRLFAYSNGPSRILAELAELRLRRFGLMVVAMTASGRDLAETLQLLAPGDAVLATGFQRGTQELVAVLEHAHALGCPSVFITDTLQSQYRDRASVVLAARRGPVSTFHSLTVPMAIVNTLILSVAMARSRESVAALEQLQSLRAGFGLDLEADSR